MLSSPGKFETATRLGFAARAVMYALIGYLALRTGRTEDGAGVIDYLDTGGGRILLAAMAVGFLGYGVWRLLDAWSDASGHGDDAKGLAIRGGGAVSGLIHLGLGVLALASAAGLRGGGGGGATEQGAATALSLPGGWIMLLAAAAALLATGIVQLGKSWKLGFLRNLSPPPHVRRWVAWLGRAGYLARGIVFLIIAWFFSRAAMAERSEQAGGIAEALASLPSTPQMLVAAGLLLFGLFSLVEARYRRIPRPDMLSR
ncbi:MAG TPA: DUF1206 domain-containing protein [Allosphingosinicella sp.]|jgi:hypothetical protein